MSKPWVPTTQDIFTRLIRQKTMFTHQGDGYPPTSRLPVFENNQQKTSFSNDLKKLIVSIFLPTSMADI